MGIKFYYSACLVSIVNPSLNSLKMPRKTPKYVRKRKVFKGVQYQVLQKRKMNAGEVPEEITASERKLSLNTGPTCEDPRQLEGFYIISGPQLATALQKAHVCLGGHLIPLENTSKKDGLNCAMVLRCSICKKEETFFSSENACEGRGESAEINRRATLAATEVGLAQESLCDLLTILGTAPPVKATTGT
ncbi:uncharacterized protein LOC105439140 [Strongylocentrotus purpuratus]|uniref:Mutator-like transposase domain-containing protein n=1 Tax=Strongylocentrotus purpuratus TaxID=7668 RepID=A0A7M7PP65_STRPU|nr:uncharacterized protein LOC105439140 [Strongylocentrotus purpuratus]